VKHNSQDDKQQMPHELHLALGETEGKLLVVTGETSNFILQPLCGL
jgi:hypothetical protein